MSGLSRSLLEPSPDCARRRPGSPSGSGRMKGLPHLSIAKVMPGMAAAALLSAGLSPMAPANAQTFSSFYTSTAPKDCHVAGARNGVDDSTIRLVWGFLCQGGVTPFCVVLCIPFFCSTRAASILPSRPHISIAVRAQRRSRTALLQRRRRLVLDGREHGGRLPAIGWLAAR
jgi:hypothetical protein